MRFLRTNSVTLTTDFTTVTPDFVISKWGVYIVSGEVVVEILDGEDWVRQQTKSQGTVITDNYDCTAIRFKASTGTAEISYALEGRKEFGGGGGSFNFQGTIDCSSNPNYPEAEAGDFYVVSVAGRIGGASGTRVVANQLIICLVDNAGGTQAAVGSSWNVSGGDMRKATYDTDGDGLVDNAETLYDGTNTVTAAQAKDAYDKRHTQNTDQYLDFGGASQSAAADVKDAVTKKHTQNTDTILNSGGANEVTAAQLKLLRDTTVPAKADKVSGATDGNFASLDENGNLEDSGRKHSDYALSGHNHDATYAAISHDHDDDYLNKGNTDAFTPDAEYEPATKKYVDDSISASGGGDMSKSTYDTDDDGRVDKAESVDDGTNVSTAAQVKGAVDNSHTHSNKTLLDSYTQTEANLADAVSKRHSQNTDTGTNQNAFAIGDGVDTDKVIEANNGDANEPQLKYNSSTNKWQFSNNGTDFSDMGTGEGSGSGDMEKSVYDQDDDGRVDVAEAINDGTNSASAADIADAVSKKHTQHTDTGTTQQTFQVHSGSSGPKLKNATGVLEVRNSADSAYADLKVDDANVQGNLTDGTHSKTVEAISDHIDSTGNPHSVTKSHVGLGDVPNLNTTDAVANEHVQNTDTGTSGNNFDIGDNTDTTKSITAQNGDTNKPKIRYNHTTSSWQYSNNGTDFEEFGVAEGGGEGSGDMSKSTYDTDNNGIVDSAESLNDDDGNIVTAKQAVKHLYNTVLLGFKLAVVESLSFFNLIDGVIDEYEDQTGIDDTASTGETYDEAGDFYKPTSGGTNTNYKLILHGNGDDAATSTTDDSPSGHTINFNGHAQLDTAQKKFGSASFLFDGNGDYLSIDDSADWDLGSNLFTIHFWIRFNSVASQQVIFSQRASGSDRMAINWAPSRWEFQWEQGGSGGGFSRTWSPSINTWYHIAIIRGWGGNSNTMAITVDGTLLGSTYTVSTNFLNHAASLLIGQEGSTAYLNGWLDEFVWVKGEALWTADFTAPSSESSSDLPPSDMILISEAVAAEAQPGLARIILFEEDVDSITLNTDLIAKVSRDNGTTYTNAVLTDLGNYNSTIRILAATLDISGQPAGTSMKYRIDTDNDKALKIHGTGLLWS